MLELGVRPSRESMKLFIGVIVAAAIIGGFVGGELMDRTFSVIGAVVGGVGLAAVLLGLGASFDAQERKKRKVELAPEILGVFDRMFGKVPASVQRPAQRGNAPAPRAASGTTQDAEAFYLDTVEKLLAIQLMPKYASPKEAFGSVMTNKRAAGYVFGFHDSLLQRLQLVDPAKTAKGAALMEESYKRTFGEQAGFALYSMSAASQENPEFQEGRMNGGNEIVEYIERKVPALGLGRILILGAKA